MCIKKKTVGVGSKADSLSFFSLALCVLLWVVANDNYCLYTMVWFFFSYLYVLYLVYEYATSSGSHSFSVLGNKKRFFFFTFVNIISWLCISQIKYDKKIQSTKAAAVDYTKESQINVGKLFAMLYKCFDGFSVIEFN